MTISQTGKDSILSLQVGNLRKELMTLYLEPWGHQLPIESGARLKIIMQGPNQGLLEIEYRDEGITLHGWVGSTIEILDADTD
jgi:hypothetical protein